MKEQNKYIYDESRFSLMNRPEFTNKIIKLEKIARINSIYKWKLESLKFPLLIIASTFFIYHLWNKMPYKLIYKHVTVC